MILLDIHTSSFEKFSFKCLVNFYLNCVFLLLSLGSPLFIKIEAVFVVPIILTDGEWAAVKP